MSAETPVAAAPPAARRAGPGAGTLAGALAVAGTALIAEALGQLAPAVGPPAIALVLGMAFPVRYIPDDRARRVVAFALRLPLQAAIVVLGATFELGHVVRIGRVSLPLMLVTLGLALAAAWWIGRHLRGPPKLQLLVGVGTAICSASAIGAVSAVVAASEVEIAYAISTIFVFNVVAVLMYPAVGHLFSLGQQTFGLWTGTAVNDTSSVVAAGYAYGSAAGGIAVLPKLARTTMIVPIVLMLAAARARRSKDGTRPPLRRLLPLFLVWFLVAAA